MPTIAASDWGCLHAHGVARRLAVEHDQHLLVHAGADRIHGQQRRSARRVALAQRLHEQELAPLELPVLVRGDERADHAGDDHRASGVGRLPSTTDRRCRRRRHRRAARLGRTGTRPPALGRRRPARRRRRPRRRPRPPRGRPVAPRGRAAAAPAASAPATPRPCVSRRRLRQRARPALANPRRPPGRRCRRWRRPPGSPSSRAPCGRSFRSR